MLNVLLLSYIWKAHVLKRNCKIALFFRILLFRYFSWVIKHFTLCLELSWLRQFIISFKLCLPPYCGIIVCTKCKRVTLTWEAIKKHCEKPSNVIVFTRFICLFICSLVLSKVAYQLRWQTNLGRIEFSIGYPKIFYACLFENLRGKVGSIWSKIIHVIAS